MLFYWFLINAVHGENFNACKNMTMVLSMISKYATNHFVPLQEQSAFTINT